MTVRVDVHLGATDLHDALVADARHGLTARPKDLPPKWFYDDRGSQLFDEITRLDEYYPTRAERSILVERADEIARASGADTLIELGSGTSEKTRLLLDALARAGRLRRFVPFDVSETTLRDAARDVAAEHPRIDVHAVVGDFERHLELLPRGGRRIIAFLGGTIGNLPPTTRAAFLASVASGLEAGDSFLLGTDLVKDTDRLVAAYDDATGVTAAFNKNVLSVINRELNADFDLDAFSHVAKWNAQDEWIEMWLESSTAQTVKVPDLDLIIEFEPGEQMRTEISAKFTRPKLETELATAGLALQSWWTDRDGDFALTLSTPK